MNHPKIGSVIRILDQYRLIIETGNSNVYEGETVEVYDEGEDIITPDGKNLGPFIIVKDRLDIIQVEDKYAICEKMETKTIKKPLLPDLSISPLLQERTVSKQIPLKVNQESIQPLGKLPKVIQIGDFVRKA